MSFVGKRSFWKRKGNPSGFHFHNVYLVKPPKLERFNEQRRLPAPNIQQVLSVRKGHLNCLKTHRKGVQLERPDTPLIPVLILNSKWKLNFNSKSETLVSIIMDGKRGKRIWQSNFVPATISKTSRFQPIIEKHESLCIAFASQKWICDHRFVTRAIQNVVTLDDAICEMFGNFQMTMRASTSFYEMNNRIICFGGTKFQSVTMQASGHSPKWNFAEIKWAKNESFLPLTTYSSWIGQKRKKKKTSVWTWPPAFGVEFLFFCVKFNRQKQLHYQQAMQSFVAFQRISYHIVWCQCTLSHEATINANSHGWHLSVLVCAEWFDVSRLQLCGVSVRVPSLCACFVVSVYSPVTCLSHACHVTTDTASSTRPMFISTWIQSSDWSYWVKSCFKTIRGFNENTPLLFPF